MEFLELLKSILRQWRLLAVLCGAAGVAAYLGTYLLDESYEATALVLVRPEEQVTVDPRSGDEELLGYPVNAAQAAPETPVNTYIKIIESRTMAERVVRGLGLDRTEPEESNWLLEALQPAIEALARSVVIAKDLALYGKVFPPLSDLEEAIEKFQDSIELTAVETTHLFEIMYEAEDPTQAAVVASATAELLLGYIAEQNTTEHLGALKFLGEQRGASEARLGEARESLLRFKRERGTISFEEEVSEAIRLLGQLEGNLESTEAKLAGLAQEFLLANPKLATVRAERDQLRESFLRHRRALAGLPAVEATLSAIELDVQSAEEVFGLLEREFEEARIRQAKQISEMRIVSRPAPPMYPAGPLRALYAGGAVFIALLLGIGWLGAVELLDPTLRRVEEAESLLGSRVLATIPPARRVASGGR